MRTDDSCRSWFIHKRAECHILDNEASSREYIEQVWAEAMEIFRSGDFRLMLSKDSSEYLKDYQKQFTDTTNLRGLS